MPHHCAVVQIATGEHSAENLIHHVRSHCRGLKSVSSHIPCLTGSSIGPVLTATLEFSREGDRKFSLHRLQHARYCGASLKMTCAKLSRHCNVEGSMLQKDSRLSLIISVVSPNEPNLAGLKKHILVHTGGIIDRYIVGRSKIGRTKINCTLRTAERDAVMRLRRSTFQGRLVDVEVKKAPNSCGSLSHTPVSPLPTLAPANHLLSPRVSASHENPMGEPEYYLVISSLGFATTPDVELLEHHISSYSGGTVRNLRLGSSQRGRVKVTCSVRTSMSAPLKRLRQSRYNGKELDVEVLRINRSNTSLGQASAADTAPTLRIPTVFSLRMSSLPPRVDVQGLNHHIRSHTGGQVTELSLTLSPNGIMEATCTVHTRIDPQSAVERLQEARFRGLKVHAERINQYTQSSPPAQLRHNFPIMIRETSSTQPVSGRKGVHRLPCQAASPNRAQLATIRAVATNFTRFLSLDPKRLDRSQDDQGIEDLYQEFLLDRLSVTVSKSRLTEVDDESSTYDAMPSHFSPAGSLMGDSSEPTNYHPTSTLREAARSEASTANVMSTGPSTPSASTSHTANLLDLSLPPVDNVSVETDGQSIVSSEVEGSDEIVNSGSLGELRSTRANETHAGGIFDIIGRHMAAESGEWSIVPDDEG
jgi:hypothetical protein